MKNIFLISICLTILTQIQCQNPASLSKKSEIIRKFTYKRTLNIALLNGGGAGDLVDTIVITFKQVYKDSLGLFLFTERFFPKCYNDKDFTLDSRCIEGKSACILLLDLKSQKMYVKYSFEITADSVFKLLSQNNYVAFDTLVHDEDNNRLINGKEYSIKTLIFSPFVNYNGAIGVSETSVYKSQFPNRIKTDENEDRLFEKSNHRGITETITINKDLIIKKYTYLPVYGNIISYKYILLSID
jgi:hypothetical protein